MLTLDKVPPPAVASEAKLGILQRLLALMNSAPVAYVLMACVILKLMWGMWDFRDLTPGDSAPYYSDACLAYDRLRFNLSWTPLFQVLGAIILHISHQPLMYCIIVRLTLVLTLGLLALAVTRRLLPPLVAWAVSIWWVTLPITFNTIFEVHLLGTVPIIATWLILSGKNLSDQQMRWRRGCALAVMVGAAGLVRNEQALYFGLFLPVVLLAEFGQWRKSTQRPSIAALLKPYWLPMVVTAAIFGLFYLRAMDRYPALFDRIQARHTNNTGQIYCVGFQQRHPGVWKKSAWNDYNDLMTKTFGKPEITMSQAFKANPQAMTEHFLWNVSLIPSGLQLLLFNCMSGSVNPDYVKVPVAAARANVLTGLMILSVMLGLFCAWRQRRETLAWLKQHRWMLAAMACYVPIAFFIMVMQRPRASYVLAFGLELIALTGFCLWRLCVSTRLARASAFLCPAVMLLTFVFTAPFYPKHPCDRKLMEYTEFLRPYRLVLASGRKQVLVPDFGCEISCYLYDGDGTLESQHFLNSLNLDELHNRDLAELLQRKGIEHVLVDFPWCTKPVFHQLEKAKGWKLVALKKEPWRELALYTRSPLADQRYPVLGCDPIYPPTKSTVQNEAQHIAPHQ